MFIRIKIFTRSLFEIPMLQLSYFHYIFLMIKLVFKYASAGPVLESKDMDVIFQKKGKKGKKGKIFESLNKNVQNLKRF